MNGSVAHVIDSDTLLSTTGTEIKSFVANPDTGQVYVTVSVGTREGYVLTIETDGSLSNTIALQTCAGAVVRLSDGSLYVSHFVEMTTTATGGVAKIVDGVQVATVGRGINVRDMVVDNHDNIWMSTNRSAVMLCGGFDDSNYHVACLFNGMDDVAIDLSGINLGDVTAHDY